MVDKKDVFMHGTGGSGEVDLETVVYPITRIVVDEDDKPIAIPKELDVSDADSYLTHNAANGKTKLNLTALQEAISAQVTSAIASYMNTVVYPVGSLYVTSKSGNPHDILGFGTWEQITGRFLVAAGNNDDTGLNLSAGAEGGSKDAVVVNHTHAITNATFTGSTTELDFSHTHGMLGNSSGDCYSSSVIANGKSKSIYCGYVETDAVSTYNFAYRTYDASAAGSDHPYIEKINFVKTYTPTGSISLSIVNAGTNGANKNMPPYLAVYMWKRTN